MDTLAHEYTHLIVAQLSHNTVPVWLQEGIARFEQTRWRKAPEIVLSATEQALLNTGLRKGRLITFDEMHPSMAKLPSQEAAALAYAEVYTLVGWMQQKIGYKGIRDLIAAQKDGKSARRAVSDAMGMPWPKVESEWHAHLKAGDPKARAGKGIKFAKGGTDSENVGLESLNPRARTLVEIGKFDRAIELATPLAAADDRDATPAVTLGIARSARHQWPEAISAYEQALRVSPFDPQTRCGLAEAYQQVGDSRAARERAASDELKN